MPASHGRGNAAENPLRGLGLLSLVLLVAQNTILILLVYAAATRARYDTTAVLFYAELLKFMASCALGVVQVKGSLTRFVGLMLDDIQRTRHPLQMALPAGLYLLQNNLLFVALGRLSPVAFQITYQLKIPATAAFSTLLLGRRFSRPQIYAMLALMLGVIFVQLDLPKAAKTPVTPTSPSSSPAGTHRHLVGFVSVLICALTSGYASVYFETILKAEAGQNGNAGFVPLRTTDEEAGAGSTAGKKANNEVPIEDGPVGEQLSTLVITNVYLSCYSALALPFVGFVRDGTIMPQTTGFTSLVWAIVSLQALGGLIIALVIRYSDNVTKTFALTLSVLICSFVQVVQFSLRPGILFIAGVVIVLGSTYMYGAATVKV